MMPSTDADHSDDHDDDDVKVAGAGSSAKYFLRVLFLLLLDQASSHRPFLAI